jgi:hypothetical protein
MSKDVTLYVMKKDKKYYQQILLNLAFRSFRRKLRSKHKKKLRNRRLVGVNLETKKEENIENILKQRYHNYKHIKAPVYFSLTQNTEETLEFIGKMEECFKNKKKVFVDMSHVEFIANGAIVVMLSILVHFKANKIDFNGNFPKSSKARTNLKNSGFFKYINKDFLDQEIYSFENEICTHANKKANSELSDKIIKKASQYIWGEERRCTGVQRVFLELMQNTNNHASISKQGDKHWWATVNHSDEKKVCFSFIDFGVGIFESLANKKEDNKFFDAINKVKNVFNFTSNAELLKLLLQGEVHRTVTGKYYRGKGLPGIFEACKTNKISNLIIISNDALADFSNDKFISLKNKLSGTYVSWELNENNINIKDTL